MAESQFTKRKIKFFVVILLLVAIFAVAAGVGIHFYFGHYFEASDISDSLADQLTIGSSFTVNDILESEKYSYGWMKSDINVEVLVDNPSFDENADDSKEEKYTVSQDVLGYDAGTRTFTVLGIGSGIIDFRNPLDSSVGLQVPFSTKFAIDDTELILEENYPEFFDDGLIVKDEIDSVDELRFTAPRSYNVGEFFMCPNLYRFVLSSEDLLRLDGLENIDKNVMFYVTDGLYGEYMLSSHWANYRERVFPIVDLSAGKHTLVFEFKGGQMASVGTDDTRYFSSVDDGGTINLSDFIIERTGYTFLGWYTSNDNGNTLTQTRIHEDYVFQADTKLYADWSANEYEIVYHDSYVTELPDSQKIKYDQQGAISATILERTGYTFIGWALIDGATAVDFTPGMSVMNLATENGVKIDLYAVWAANAYTIIYDGNGSGVTNVPARQADIPFDTQVTISDVIPVWTGHTFIGWSTNKSASDYEYEPGQKVKNLVSDSNGQVVLYAIWSANTYSIHYDANGGSNAPQDQDNLVYGESLQLSHEIPLRTGYNFKGWARNQGANSASYSAGATVSNLVADAGGVVVLYAVWSADSFQIQYNANGGNDAPSATIVTYDNSSSITNSSPSRTGYKFKGWSTLSTGNVEYTSGQNLPISQVNALYGRASGSPKHVTLYAIWEAITYSIKYDANGGSSTPATQTATYDVSINLASAISRSGKYNFGGWKCSTGTTYSAGTSVKNLTSVDGAVITMTAIWNAYCISEGTSILLADGSSNKVENLSLGDELLVWDFVNGTYKAAPIVLLYAKDTLENTILLDLSFDDGSSIELIRQSLFDVSRNEWICIDKDNVESLIGDKFYKIRCDQSGDAVVDSYGNYIFDCAQLTAVHFKQEFKKVYTVVTAVDYNFFANGYLCAESKDELLNLFMIGDGMKYDQTEMQKDIEQYGLYSYEDFERYLTYDQYVNFNAKYMSIVVGKGYLTFEQLLQYIQKYIIGA